MDVGLRGVVRDKIEDCQLDLYVDADLARVSTRGEIHQWQWSLVTG